MDYESLYCVLPKEPKKWSMEDVQQWLNFIGLSSLQTTFSKMELHNSLKLNRWVMFRIDRGE